MGYVNVQRKDMGLWEIWVVAALKIVAHLRDVPQLHRDFLEKIRKKHIQIKRRTRCKMNLRYGR